MDLIITIQPPKGQAVPLDLELEIVRILNRAEVSHQIEMTLGGPRIHLIDTSDAECRFIIRLFQRAGYDTAINSHDS
jgi:hypothetical protein